MRVCALAFIILIFPFLMVGQFSVSSDNTFDFGKDNHIFGIDDIVIFEKLDESDELSYLFTDSIDFEWHYHTSFSDSLIMSSQGKDTLAVLDSLQQGLYELKTVTDSFYFFIVDFSDYQHELDSVWIQDEGDSCNTIRLFARLIRQDISVYDKINDSIHLLFDPVTTYKWENFSKEQSSPYSIDAPYQDTSYLCSPYSADFFESNDLFVKYDSPDTMTTLQYDAIAVSLGTLEKSIPEDDDKINRFKASSITEGSAPLDVTYTVSPTEAVEYSSWWIWDVNNDQPSSPTYRYQDKVTHSFVKYVLNGYRVKVEVGNEFCHVSDSAEVTVFDSSLEAPNVLVLSGEYGKFKLAYQSIVPETFKATIYNRWGRRIYSWDDPDGGWDGRSVLTDAFVSPGVYYCAVKARGTDGKKHDTIFEITVIRGKK